MEDWKFSQTNTNNIFSDLTIVSSLLLLVFVFLIVVRLVII